MSPIESAVVVLILLGASAGIVALMSQRGPRC